MDMINAFHKGIDLSDKKLMEELGLKVTKYLSSGN